MCGCQQRQYIQQPPVQEPAPAPVSEAPVPQPEPTSSQQNDDLIGTSAR